LRRTTKDAGLIDAAYSVPPKVEARRKQILDAACDCVRRAGFHGASMAEIATAAGLSVGQIYRYFENKEAIIAAIVAQDLAAMHEKFAAFESLDAPLAETMITQCAIGIERKYEPKRTGLALEVLAEAARNPRVAAIVRAADASERALAMGLLEKIIPEGCADAERIARAEVLRMLFDGMMMRAVSNPDGDRVAIARVLEVVMRCLLLSPPADEPAA
jgi:AcrR family transcriptional regulator